MSSLLRSIQDSRRRGSGINRHRSRTFSKTSLRGVQAQSAGASRESSAVQAVQGVKERSRGVQGQSSATSRKTRKIRQTFRPNTHLHPGLCAGGSSRTNGSRCPSAHAAAFSGGFNRLQQLLHGFFTKF